MKIKLILFSLVIMKFICTATTAPLDSDHKRSAPTTTTTTVKVPPYIKKIYHKMSQAMKQDDLHTSLKYLRTIRTVHWLEPVTHDTSAVTTEPYKHQYTITFNISGLSQKKQHPNYAELFLHVLTNHQNPAQVKVASDHIQQPVMWTQPLQASGKDDGEMPEVMLVRISLTSLTNSSLWEIDNTLTVTVASTNAIRIPSKNHHKTALGLVLYMGGAPEAIDELLKTPIVAADQMLTNKKETYSIGAANKRSTTSNTPCQLKKGFKVKFSEVKGGFEKIIHPEVVDIGKCIGQCPMFLHHLHNPSQHAEVRNLLVSREGSAGSDIATASCVPVTFKPLPVVLFNSETNTVSTSTLDELEATSCGCR